MNRACQLLTTTRMTVLDIALEVGYHNAKTLNRSFLKYRLMTPSAYRAGGHSRGHKEPERPGRVYYVQAVSAGQPQGLI